MTAILRAVVFGGAGLLGSLAAEGLRRRGVETVRVDVTAGAGADIINADVADVGQVVRLLASERPALVLNFAHLLADATEQDTEAAFATNVTGHWNVLEASRLVGAGRVVYASSIGVYGQQADHGDRDLTEADHGHPRLLYQAHKQINEAHAAHFQRRHGLRCIGVRISSVLSFGRTAGLSAGLSSMARAVRLGEPALCPWSPAQAFNLIHSEDAADVCVTVGLAAEPRHDIYNTGGERVTVASLIATMRAERPDAQIRFAEPAIPIPNCSRISFARLADEFPIARLPIAVRIRRGIAGLGPVAETG
jgi:nucleoside-diphosphate-sugar epimerase